MANPFNPDSKNPWFRAMSSAWDRRYAVDDPNNFGQFAELEQHLRDAGYGDLVDSARAQWTGVFGNYREGLLDNVANYFGARSGFDKNRENALAQYAEALYDISKQEQQNEFNSEVSKTARMRQAGENPDLLGTGDVSDAAVPAEDTNNVLPNSASLGLEELTTFGTTLFNCFQGALGLVGSFQNIKSMRLANQGQEISNQESIVGFAKDIVRALNPSVSDVASDYVDAGGNLVPGNPDESVSLDPNYRRKAILDKFDLLFNPTKSKSGLSKSSYKRLRNSILSVIDSSGTSLDQLSDLSGEMTAQQDVVGKHDSRYYSPDIHRLRQVMTPLISARDEITRLVAEYEKNKSQFDNEYYQQLNDLEAGSVMAQNDITMSNSSASRSVSEADSAEYKAVVDKINKIKEEAKSKVIQKLTELADSGDFTADAMLYLYSFGDMFNISASVGNLGNAVGALGKLAF